MGLNPAGSPIPPVSMLKVQVLKHLLQVPSIRRLALLLKRNNKIVKVCGFRRVDLDGRHIAPVCALSFDMLASLMKVCV